MDRSSAGDVSKEEQEERIHFQRIINSFGLYKTHSLKALKKREDYLEELRPDHQKLLKKHGYHENLEELKFAIEKNAKLIKDIVSCSENMFENVIHDSNSEWANKVRPTHYDLEKVQSTLKQIVRDWSDAGAAEREDCYGKILLKMEKHFPDVESRSLKKVLVPGAGLGRLAFEIAKLGFECQGSEFSLFMLIASHFILNKCQSVNSHTVYPYIHNYCNNVKAKDQLASVTFPDIDPNELQEEASFSMAGGDFMEVYNAVEYISSQDCVVTCFFMDCAHNILEFIEVIHRVLKTGGIWINLGPLLYHFADMLGEKSIEPSYETVKGIVTDFGFEFLEEDTNVKCTYDQNPKNMLQYSYKCAFFTAKKIK